MKSSSGGRPRKPAAAAPTAEVTSRRSSGAIGCTETYSAIPSLSHTGASVVALAHRDVRDLVAHQPVPLRPDGSEHARVQHEARPGERRVVRRRGDREGQAVEVAQVATRRGRQRAQELVARQRVDDDRARPAVGHRRGDVRDPVLDRLDQRRRGRDAVGVEDAQHAAPRADHDRPGVPGLGAHPGPLLPRGVGDRVEPEDARSPRRGEAEPVTGHDRHRVVPLELEVQRDGEPVAVVRRAPGRHGRRCSGSPRSGSWRRFSKWVSCCSRSLGRGASWRRNAARSPRRTAAARRSRTRASPSTHVLGDGGRPGRLLVIAQRAGRQQPSGQEDQQQDAGEGVASLSWCGRHQPVNDPRPRRSWGHRTHRGASTCPRRCRARWPGR